MSIEMQDKFIQIQVAGIFAIGEKDRQKCIKDDRTCSFFADEFLRFMERGLSKIESFIPVRIIEHSEHFFPQSQNFMRVRDSMV